ncbi:hypothetical protein QSH57_015683 [Fusarium oxysporum f. sp. vasinfectum]|nr:hypothetical protein QSH57_015683 [Fusarium oxysporum f. sp. vasinfectum]
MGQFYSLAHKAFRQVTIQCQRLIYGFEPEDPDTSGEGWYTAVATEFRHFTAYTVVPDPCIPPARGDLETLGGKLIDYAFLLRPDKALETRITNFVAELPGVQSFNQSTHGPLRKEPTGVLIETKVESKRQGEGKTQLGIWLASWFGRVAKFEGSKKLPFLPVILVVCENWELYSAFNKEDRFEVCGPI